MKKEIKTKKFKSDLSILYIDSDVLLQEKISSHLRKIFSTVYQAYSGVDGLEEYKKNKPDIVLTDLNLLNKNAFEMIIDIQELQADIPIIVLSYKNSDFTLLETLDIGLVALLEKPVNISNLNKALQKIISSKFNKVVRKQNSGTQITPKKLPIVQQKTPARKIQQILKKTKPEKLSITEQKPIQKKVLPKIKPQNIQTLAKKPESVQKVKKPQSSENTTQKKAEVTKSTNIVKKNIPLSCTTVLTSTLKSKSTVICINNYKGLVINNNGTLLKVSNNTLTIQITKTQLIAVLFEKQIIININQQYIQAKLIDIDKVNSIATFTNYEFIKFNERDLSNKRIAVDKSFKASIGFNNSHTELTPINISTEYITVHSNQALNLKTNDIVDLTFGFEINGPSSLILEKKFTKAFATGTIQRVTKLNTKQEIIIKHTLKKAGQNIFKKYLQEREMEIINELKMRIKQIV